MTRTDRSMENTQDAKRSRLVLRKVSPWLLSRFAWCAAEVSEMATSNHGFRQSLLQLTPRRFHLIGLSLALLRQPLIGPHVDISELADLLSSAPGKEVIARIYGRVPRGALSCLGKLPDRVLRPGAYVNLINLLEEPCAAKVLFHIEGINSNTIGLLMRLEPSLRKPRLIGLLQVPRAAATMEFLVETVLRIRADASRPTVLQSLASVGTAEGLEKWFCGWVEKAVFPAPPWQGNEIVVPLQTLRAMQEAARSFRNCLQAKVISVISGATYYYVRRADPLTVVELVNDRLAGWIVCDMKGMENSRLPPRLKSLIREEFKAVGIGSMPAFEGMPRGINPLYWLDTDFQWPRA